MIEIVRLRIDEVARLKAIRLRSLQEAPNSFGTTFAEASAWTEEAWIAQAKTIPTFLAANRDADIGIVRITLEKTNSKIAWLISMWVSPEARGMKVGSRLIDAAIQWARQNGVKIVRLDVGDSNTAAISLYDAKGFKANGVVGSLPEPRTHLREHQRELTITATVLFSAPKKEPKHKA